MALERSKDIHGISLKHFTISLDFHCVIISSSRIYHNTYRLYHLASFVSIYLFVCFIIVDKIL